MATTIVNPSSAAGGATDQIDQDFSKIFSMFGPTTGSSSGSGSSGLATQPISGDSLTQFFRSLSNYLGGTGAGLTSTGTGLVGGGVGVAGTGADIATQGLGTTETGLATMQPAIDFYNKILTGDPTATTAALAPTAANINQITAGATDQASQGMPAGGYRAATLAGLPFAQASQVGNAALQLQPAAAQALDQLGGQQATIGGEQATIGQGISSTGIGVGQLGSTMTGQGLSAAEAALTSLLQKMGYNIQGGTSNMFNTFTGGLSNLI